MAKGRRLVGHGGSGACIDVGSTVWSRPHEAPLVGFVGHWSHVHPPLPLLVPSAGSWQRCSARPQLPLPTAAAMRCPTAAPAVRLPVAPAARRWMLPARFRATCGPVWTAASPATSGGAVWHAVAAWVCDRRSICAACWCLHGAGASPSPRSARLACSYFPLPIRLILSHQVAAHPHPAAEWCWRPACMR